MKKNFFYATALVLGLAFTATACSDDDDNSTAVSYTHLTLPTNREV